jgi:DNA-nicking Smr family endonuclease
MKKPPGRPPAKGGKHLSEADRVVWQHTAATLKPLKRAKPRVHAAMENEPVSTPNLAKSSNAAATARPKPLGHALPAPTRSEPPPAPSPRKTPSLTEFDGKRARKLRSGQMEIDARIDLHGMRQSEAHVALRRFLHAAHMKGHRVVLVITGKGAPAGTPRDDHWSESMGRSDRGILRRNVPMWLADPELRAIVVSYTAAAVRHGGDGALYVHLRRLR